MKIGIGIDTGGTYTDAIAYDFASGEILGSAKALTTRSDLTEGILGALDGLPASLLRAAEMLSLSTTLATNACVEDKGGSAKLIFFGGDKKVIDELGGRYGLPPSREIHIQEAYTTFTGEVLQEPDWAQFRDAIQRDFAGLDGAGIIEMNALKNNAVVEKKAKQIFREQFDIPVACGHELFSQLNCLQRGAGTLLNARLFPVIIEFLDAIRRAMEKRGMSASIVIVRSDGSLMSEAFARLHPVETLLCGPAASVGGGVRLSGAQNSLLVDMGGTTTDIALVRNGSPVRASGGVSIGKWRTFVNGLYIKTVGLGGDSAVHCRDGRLVLEEYRVVPLCVAAAKYPAVTENLRRLCAEVERHTKFLHEHYLLVRDISGSDRYTPEERRLCAALRNGPLPLREAAAAAGKDVYTLKAERLLRDGIVQLCGFTPTDAMHIRGDFSRYSAEASLLGAQFVASNLGITPEQLCARVYDEVERKLYLTIVKALLENRYPDSMKNGVGPETERLILAGYEMAKAGRRGLVSLSFTTDCTLCGIGAPIRIFLEDVASLLGTTAVIPDHYEVANALGAVVGNICAGCTVEVRRDSGIEERYTVYGEEQVASFGDLEEAEAFALAEAERAARAEAVLRGAAGELTVTSSLERSEGETTDAVVYLGTRATAQAVGAMGF